VHAVTTVLLAFTAIVQAQPHGVRVTDSTPHALSITSSAVPSACVNVSDWLMLVLLGPVWLFLRPPLPASPRAWFDLALVGFLIQVVYFGCAWTAMHTGSSAGTVALITSLHPTRCGLSPIDIQPRSISGGAWLHAATGCSA